MYNCVINSLPLTILITTIIYSTFHDKTVSETITASYAQFGRITPTGNYGQERGVTSRTDIKYKVIHVIAG